MASLSQDKNIKKLDLCATFNTCDMWHMTFSQNFSCLGKPVFWRLGGKGWLGNLLKYKGICKTDPATPGVLFSLNRPYWADSVIKLPCPSVWMSVCLRHWVQFLFLLLALRSSHHSKLNLSSALQAVKITDAVLFSVFNNAFLMSLFWQVKPSLGI